MEKTSAQSQKKREINHKIKERKMHKNDERERARDTLTLRLTECFKEGTAMRACVTTS